MAKSTVSKIIIGRIPRTETTIIDFDGIAFALDEKQLVRVIADCSKALSGIYLNRENAAKDPA
jgi:hypothetical protein